jgi:hypothetical protein
MIAEPTPKKKKPSRIGLYLPVLALLVLAIGWSIFWYVAATVTGREIGAWIKAEAEDGRNWTCPDRRIAGYPFRVEISCNNPSFSGPAAGIPVAGKLAGVHLVAQIYDPKLVVGEADGPFEFNVPQDGTHVNANWTLLQISVRGTPDALQRVSLVADQLDVRGSIADKRPFAGRSGQLQLHVQRGAAEQRAYDFAVTSSGTASADLNDATGSSEPANVQTSGTLTQAETIGGGTIPQRLERWRTSGGSLNLNNAVLAQGALNVQGTGTLRLDSTHRLDGRIDLTASGLSPVLKRYGIAPQVLDIGNLIGGFLTGRAPAPSSGQIRVALTFDRGRVGLGPVQGLALLPPLY